MPVIKLAIYNRSNNKTKKKKKILQSINVVARKWTFTIPAGISTEILKGTLLLPFTLVIQTYWTALKCTESEI